MELDDKVKRADWYHGSVVKVKTTTLAKTGTALLAEISRSVCYYRIMTVNRNLGPIINHHRRQPKFTPSKIWGCRLGLEDGDPVYEPDSPLRSRSTY